MSKLATAGQAVAAELRWNFRIGTRTRRYRTALDGAHDDLHTDIVRETEAVCVYGPAFPRAETLKAGWGAVLSYQEHYLEHRMNPLPRRHIELMSLWQFSALLGEMVDAGVTNVGQGEQFFREMGREDPAQVCLALRPTSARRDGFAPARR